MKHFFSFHVFSGKMTEISFKKGIINTIVEVPQKLIENSKFIEQHWEPHQDIQIKITEEEHFENIKYIILAIEEGTKIKLEDFDKFMETVELFGLKTKILRVILDLEITYITLPNVANVLHKLMQTNETIVTELLEDLEIKVHNKQTPEEFTSDLKTKCLRKLLTGASTPAVHI